MSNKINPTPSQQLHKIINKKLGGEHSTSETATSQTTTSKPSHTDKATLTSQLLKLPAGYAAKESLLGRAERRRRLNLMRKQQNLEAILALAQEYCPAVNADGEADPDWIERFFELAEDSSNKAMQRMWAKVLAGELLKPGSFSYKSLLTLKQMTQKEAEALQTAVTLSGRSSKDGFHQLLTGYYAKPSLFQLFRSDRQVFLNISKAGLSYPQILTLIDMDIIYGQEIESHPLHIGEEYRLTFASEELIIRAKRNNMVLTYHKFTHTGQALARLTSNKLNATFKQQLIENFGRGFELTFKEQGQP